MIKLHNWNQWIGTDEAGKGDYFGPLVVAGVYVEETCINDFIEKGVSDGKKVSNSRIRKLAEWMWEGFERNIVVVKKMPETYNLDYSKLRKQGKNLNSLLANMHVKAIRQLSNTTGVQNALVDKFSYHDIITPLLDQKDMNIKLETKAERDIAVAAASVIARDTFLNSIETLSEEYDIDLPRGAYQVKSAGRDFVRLHGKAALGKVAKLHFKTTNDVLS